jgi:hypothetical protein
MEQRGRNGWQTFGAAKAQERLELPRNRCHRLPFGSHGKQGVCGGLPPVAGGPLSEKEGVESRTLGRFVRRAGGPRQSLLHHYAVSAIRARVYVVSYLKTSAEPQPRATIWRKRNVHQHCERDFRGDQADHRLVAQRVVRKYERPPIARGARLIGRSRLCKVPADHHPSVGERGDGFELRRPPDVHRAPRSLPMTASRINRAFDAGRSPQPSRSRSACDGA